MNNNDTTLSDLKRLRDEIYKKSELYHLDSVILMMEGKKANGEAAGSLLTPLQPKTHQASEVTPSLFANEPADFPKKASRRQQFLFVLRSFGRPVRFPEIEEELISKLGRNILLRDTLKDLLKLGKVISAKYENINKYTFIGFPEWLNDEQNDFKPELRPEEITEGMTFNLNTAYLNRNEK